MKWMITSVIFSAGNAWLMLAFSTSKLGPTPLFLLLFLAAVTLGAFVGSVVSVIIGKVRHSQFRVAHLNAAASWAVATGFNLWATGHDFTKTNMLMPHPIYAWMSWVCVLSPTQELLNEIFPLIVEAHGNAVLKFNKKVRYSADNHYLVQPT